VSERDLATLNVAWRFAPHYPQKLGVAVSGGGDSIAALHVLAAGDWDIEAVTVNHGLRPEAADEAAFVASVCKSLGVAHTILRWRRKTKTGNLQDQARTARYQLIGTWARKRGIRDVVLGHTADDQAETFLMRLARQAGIDGLCAMARSVERDGLRWWRPFLGTTRSQLRDYLKERELEWIEDPSNDDETFERVRIRKALDVLHPLGLDVGTLAGVVDNLQSAQYALQFAAVRFFKTYAVQDRGDLVFEAEHLKEMPYETTRRLAVGGLMWVSGNPYPPRETSYSGLDEALWTGSNHTLHGCRILSDGETTRITREAKAVRDSVSSTRSIWDDRWRLSGPHRKGLEVRALGTEGLRQCPDRRESGLPRATMLASPSVWDGNTLISAPLAGFSNGWSAKLSKGRDDFAAFLKPY
jgi:tRNA(Ile)-lysidine synthase